MKGVVTKLTGKSVIVFEVEAELHYTGNINLDATCLAVDANFY